MAVKNQALIERALQERAARTLRPVTNTTDRVMEALADGHVWTVAEVQDVVRVDRTNVYDALRKLVAEGRVARGHFGPAGGRPTLGYQIVKGKKK